MNNHIRFFTATILYWRQLLNNDKYKEIITDSFDFLVRNNRVWLYGFVIMPNHIHVLWRMQEGIQESDVRRDFLKYTAQLIKI